MTTTILNWSILPSLGHRNQLHGENNIQIISNIYCNKGISVLVEGLFSLYTVIIF